MCWCLRKYVKQLIIARHKANITTGHFAKFSPRLLWGVWQAEFAWDFSFRRQILDNLSDIL